MASTVDNFQIIGKNLVTITNRMLNNQNLCKLLYYSTKQPLSEVNISNTDILLDTHIRLYPKLPALDTKGSIINVIFDGFETNQSNENTVIATIRFDIICPVDEWIIDESSLRPFLIMSELSSMFNGYNIGGIGKLRLVRSESLILSNEYSGYTMVFINHAFN